MKVKKPTSKKVSPKKVSPKKAKTKTKIKKPEFPKRLNNNLNDLSKPLIQHYIDNLNEINSSVNKWYTMLHCNRVGFEKLDQTKLTLEKFPLDLEDVLYTLEDIKDLLQDLRDTII